MININIKQSFFMAETEYKVLNANLLSDWYVER